MIQEHRLFAQPCIQRRGWSDVDAILSHPRLMCGLMQLVEVVVKEPISEPMGGLLSHKPSRKGAGRGPCPCTMCIEVKWRWWCIGACSLVGGRR